MVMRVMSVVINRSALESRVVKKHLNEAAEECKVAAWKGFQQQNLVQ